MHSHQIHVPNSKQHNHDVDIIIISLKCVPVYSTACTEFNLELGLAVVVRGLGEGNKAVQDGVRIGDEIREVNRVKGQSSHPPHKHASMYVLFIYSPCSKLG